MERLKTYIEDLAKTDNAIKQALKNGKKSFEKMNTYVYEQAREQAKGENSTYIDDDIVYAWARHYWLDYVEKEETKPKPTHKIDRKADLPKPPKPKADQKQPQQLSLFDF